MPYCEVGIAAGLSIYYYLLEQLIFHFPQSPRAWDWPIFSGNGAVYEIHACLSVEG